MVPPVLSMLSWVWTYACVNTYSRMQMWCTGANIAYLVVKGFYFFFKSYHDKFNPTACLHWQGLNGKNVLCLVLSQSCPQGCLSSQSHFWVTMDESGCRGLTERSTVPGLHRRMPWRDAALTSGDQEHLTAAWLLYLFLWFKVILPVCGDAFCLEMLLTDS